VCGGVNPLFKALNVGGNAILAPLVKRGVMSGAMTIVTYVGRKSGKTFSTPVGYKRTGEGVRIMVALPDQKQWWRNFEGDGGELTVLLDKQQRTGHAVAKRSGKQVLVNVALT
jgi:hypothetical protein